MKIAVMQPYFFPYIGYFQLINAVDKFVVLDDVNFINRGWINRNNILLNGKSHLFQVPLSDASQNKLINQIHIVKENKWIVKLQKTFEQCYRKAPFFEPVNSILNQVLTSTITNIAELNVMALKFVCKYLNIETQIIPSSSAYLNTHLKGQHRILDICLQEKSTQYINPQGGKELYHAEIFNSKGIQLNFLNTKNFKYTQFSNEFVPFLSILDLMMFNSIEEINLILNHQYELQ